MSVFRFSFIFIFYFVKMSNGFISGFPKSQCDDMDPTQIPIESLPPREEDSDFNSTSEYALEESPPTSLQISGRLNLFRIVTSAPKYRRGRKLDITIRGPEFNAFMLQVRRIGPDERRGVDKPVRVGEFTAWPPSLQPVFCDAPGKPTALTNKNYSPKSDIVVQWKAPNDDVGDIHIVGRFIVGDEYWQITESREIPLNEFPVNLNNCGKAKSCVLYSEKSKSCHEDNCDYILTYNVANSSAVEFVLGGNAKDEHYYLAVGFSKAPEVENMKMITCSRAKTIAEIKYFVIHAMEEGPVEYPLNLDNLKMDFDGQRMWCSFTLAMNSRSEGDNGLDLSMPLYQVYMRGPTNYTKAANVPIISSKMLVSQKALQIEKIRLQYHTMEKPKSAGVSATSHILFLLCSVFICLFL